MQNRIEHLTRPGRIGNLLVCNRMIMAPMGTSYASPSGNVTPRLVDYLEARAKGGVGLIIVENTLVHPHEEYGEALLAQLTLWDYNTIPLWNELTNAIHFWGSKVFVQLNYTGAGLEAVGTPGVEPVTPSPIILDNPYGKSIVSRRATSKDIDHLVTRYAEAAVIAKLAGFDGVNLHCAHGYGIAGFQSRHYNKRKDRYGGSFENRMRFGLEVLRGIKARVGDDFPISCRIPVKEFVPEGIEPEESMKIAQKYVEAGAHAIDLSCGAGSQGNKIVQSRYLPYPFLEPYLQMFKKVLNVPLIVAGSFHDPLEGERVLSEGKADFIGIGRGLLADAEYANKVAEGRLEDIRKCRRCIDGCIHTHKELHLPIDCSVNVELGRERKYEIKPSEKVKKVLVVGGGPAGMEAARVSALRGHDVTLCEKTNRLGGNLIPGSVPSFKREDKWLMEWLSSQLNRSEARIEYEKVISQSTIGEAYSFDVVIIATGATPIIPDIPGVEKAHTAIDVLLGKVKLGNEIIIVGGGLIGCETALYLAENGKTAKIIEMLEGIALDVDQEIVRPAFIERMTQSGVISFTGLRVVEINDKGAVCTDSDGGRVSIQGEDVVLCVGMKPANGLASALKGKVSECYAIGDCVEPRKVFQAIHEGSLLARRI